jgi:hypothetical protein
LKNTDVIIAYASNTFLDSKTKKRKEKSFIPDDPEPWVIRGGICGEMQVMAPHHDCESSGGSTKAFMGGQGGAGRAAKHNRTQHWPAANTSCAPPYKSTTEPEAVEAFRKWRGIVYDQNSNDFTSFTSRTKFFENMESL